VSHVDGLERIDRLAKAGEFERAFELATELLRESPDHGELWALRAHLSAQQGRYDEAINDVSRAVSLKSSEPEYFFTRGRYRLNAGDCRGAADDFTQTLQLCDRHGSDYYREVTHFFRAEAFLCLKMHEEALADCEHVRDDVRMWTTAMRSRQDIVDACMNRRR
jgi:tetratricopeptide (TPR) repeat protein